MTTEPAADAVLSATMLKWHVLARFPHVLDHAVQCLGLVDLVPRGKHHLNSADDGQRRVVAGGVGVMFPVREADDVLHQGTQANFVVGMHGGRAPPGRLQRQVLRIQRRHVLGQCEDVKSKGLVEGHDVVLLDGLTEDHDGAESELGLLRVDGPVEDFGEHLPGLLDGQEASVAEVVGSRVTGAKFPVDQMGVALDSGMVEAHVLQELLAVGSKIVETIHLLFFDPLDSRFGIARSFLHLFCLPGAQSNLSHTVMVALVVFSIESDNHERIGQSGCAGQPL